MACPEVHEHDATAGFTHHVLGLDVAMQQARGMDGAQGAAEIDADLRNLAWRQRAAFRKQCLERAPLDELGPDADLAVQRFGPVDGEHIGMAHARQQPRFVNGVGRRRRGRRGGRV